MVTTTIDQLGKDQFEFLKPAMEFRFNISPYFKADIIKVNSNLVPIGFFGDRRTLLDTTSKMSEIINDLGESSARAQGLSKPVTTAQKLRNSDDQVIYIMAENVGTNGSVTGLLKIGRKNLYVFDPHGETVQVSAPCVLDFYIHESRQRAGLGKKLFEHMLAEENIRPEKMAIDRPSEKLVGFLKKHYGLTHTIPQANNFVIYDGFFDYNPINKNLSEARKMHITASPNTALFGPHFTSDEHNKRIRSQHHSPAPPVVHATPMGRFGAPRPMCSMAEIIHSTPTAISNEPNRNVDNNDEHLLSECNGDSSAIIQSDVIDEIEEQIPNGHVDAEEVAVNSVANGDITEDIQNINLNAEIDIENIEPMQENHIIDTSLKKPTHFHYNKQHTGLKNISFNVGAAVSPTDKMEFNQEKPESFGLLKINRPIGNKPILIDHHRLDQMSTMSPTHTEGLTDQGYFDLKFHHNKLW